MTFLGHWFVGAAIVGLPVLLAFAATSKRADDLSDETLDLAAHGDCRLSDVLNHSSHSAASSHEGQHGRS